MHRLDDIDNEHRKEQIHGNKWKPETYFCFTDD